MIELLKELIAIPGLSGEEQRRSDRLAEYLRRNLPADVRQVGANIIATVSFGRPGRRLLLCSHIDTVKPCAGWTSDPYVPLEREGRIRGLGANDALASVASMTAAVMDLTATRLAGEILLLFAAEEEAGSGGFCSIERELPRYDGAIFGEPTGMQIANCMRGFMTLRLVSSGVSCHASRPHEGRNAIDVFAAELSQIRAIALRDRSPWGGATIEPTVISGGLSANQLPDRVLTTLDVRTTPEIPNEKILRLLSERRLQIEVIHNRRGPIFTPLDDPLSAAAAAAAPQCRFIPFGGSCDMAFSKAPSLVIGPGSSERSHAADEYILTEELEEARQIYSAICTEYLSKD